MLPSLISSRKMYSFIHQGRLHMKEITNFTAIKDIKGAELSSRKSQKSWAGIDIGLYIADIPYWAFRSDIGSFRYQTELWYQID